MIEYACTRERFLNDIKDHSMEVLKDDGLYRHLKFSNKGSSVYRFDLITWPRYLTITGDMGCCTFSRIDDMFKFFIMSDNDFNKDNIINPGYWEEKIQSVASYKGVEEFNTDLFKDQCIKIVNDYYEQNFNMDEVDEDEDSDDEKKKHCLEQLNQEVFFYLDDESKDCIYKRLYEFETDDFRFDICDLPDANTYTFHYIWLCYAIVWGITKYNETKIRS